jgi:hypothetical protein
MPGPMRCGPVRPHAPGFSAGTPEARLGGIGAAQKLRPEPRRRHRRGPTRGLGVMRGCGGPLRGLRVAGAGASTAGSTP